ncbi:hypothetical protein PUR71_38485 [Streptomyces sp. SP17BM10]|uniref:hypothetical protein n=1 Tax=Streptomyces sp. SP17BM10 TaxID=3002530 RepID=UPI002E784AD5|nr:hypothetical protein [Streptomyces sp. SP17BM10]MEE1788748.1 hypothetical protein [Streptomyces sp. SP17BM10]
MRRTVAVLLGASALLAAAAPVAGAVTAPAAAPAAPSAGRDGAADLKQAGAQAGAPLFGMLGSASAMVFGAVDALKGAVKLP